MEECFKLNHFQKWIDIQTNIKNKQNDKNGPIFNEIFNSNGYDACVDFPASLYYKELFDYYSKSDNNVKVILSTRDANKWYESANKTIFECQRVRRRLWFRLQTNHRLIYHFLDFCLWNKAMKGNQYKFNDKIYAMKMFNDHIKNVQKNIDSNKLLIYHVKEGWKTLCKFLNQEIPNIAYPNLNNTKEFIVENVTKRHRHANIFNVILFIGFISFICAITRYYASKNRK
eukprot:266705_1